MVYSIEKVLGKSIAVHHDKETKDRPKLSLMSSKLVEFCNRTDLHGYKYMVMKDLNVYERRCWALSVLVSIAVATYMVVSAYSWFAVMPVVTVIETTQGPIWDVPFPAVTVCDLNIISRKVARQFADNLTLPVNVTADFVFDTLRLTPLLHSTFSVEDEQKKRLQKLQGILDLNNVSIENMFRILSPASSCHQLVQACMWKNTAYNCDHLFKHVFMLQTLCCTFNYYAVDIQSEFTPMKNPRQVSSCGYQTALSILLNIEPDDYYSASIASLGVLVLIDDPYNIPDMDAPVRMMDPSTEVLIALSPERTYTTPGIRDFIPSQRQCYYKDEIKLGNFRHYSFHNCMALQRVMLLKENCDCIPFHFPMKGEQRICNFYDMDCVQNVIRMVEHGTKTSPTQDLFDFQCLPDCEHYEYSLEVALGKMANNVKIGGVNFLKNLDMQNRTILNVFFNDLVSTKYRRDVYLNWQNLLASFGGLLSLMLGFTLISGFDLIVFTFRVIFDLMTNKTNGKPLQEDAHKIINRKALYLKLYKVEEYIGKSVNNIEEKH